MAWFSTSLLPLEKREDSLENMAVHSDVQPAPLAFFSVYFLKYLCLIPASVTCPVQRAADTLWQCTEASGQHRREQATVNY